MMLRVLAVSALVAFAQPAGDWPSYGRDAAETHFSPLHQIDASNVSRLGLAWTTRTGAPRGKVEATPVMQDGVLYTSLSQGVLIAVDARTGEIQWRWDPEIPLGSVRLCCGPVNRGVAVYNGRVYAGLIDGRLVALDQKTGKLAWSTQVTEPGSDESLTAAIRVVKGKLIVGSAGAEYAVRGYFSAYDPESGKLIWRFYTVPGDPAKGFEHPELAMAAKTWNGSWWEVGGGGTVWDGMAYDAEEDLLYVGTGNGSPWNQNFRSPGGGDNLFLASILAVKPDTGRLVWHFQNTPGDMWDFTATQNMILADLTIGGRLRKVILQAPKNGFFYVLDRVTGEFLSAVPYVKQITWATGVDAHGRPIEAPGIRYKDEPVQLRPGGTGAHNWPPMAFSPQTGLVYVPGQESVRKFTPTLTFEAKRGRLSTGTEMSATDDPAVREVVAGHTGFLLAWDPVSRTERWRLTGITVGSNRGGALATAGGLVFHGDAAYHAETGQKLWGTSFDSDIASWISYMLDGKQYVAILAERWPDNRLFAFTLDGGEAEPFRLRPLLQWGRSNVPYVGGGAVVLALAAGVYFRGKRKRR